MRRALGLTAALLLAPATASAQRPERPRNVITLQPLSGVTGYFDLEYERALGRRLSVYAAPGAIFSQTQRLDGSLSVGVYGASLDLGARAFPFNDAPAGFFVDLGVGVATSSFPSQDRVQGFGVRGMFLLGYTAILAGHFVASFGLGAQVSRFTRRSGGDAEVAFLPALRFAVGWAF
ncbi:MAG: hypothetical protein IPN17_25610 [Deltaproteobacteria bacterium]|nr:hypothetical protein [Deltaproteobacteria bacterium]